MRDAHEVDRLEGFVLRHRPCQGHDISTEFLEDRDTHGIHVIKRCEACNAMVMVTVTKDTAKVLLR